MTMYTTMTRNRVLRLKAKGWLMTGQLINDLVYDGFEYFEIAFDKHEGFPILRGNGYNPREDWMLGKEVTQWIRLYKYAA